MISLSLSGSFLTVTFLTMHQIVLVSSFAMSLLLLPVEINGVTIFFNLQSRWGNTKSIVKAENQARFC
jgi:hypothetical protein